MKIHVLSDLHLEFSEFHPPPTDADVVVLAGDIGQHTHGLDWAIAEFHEGRPADRRPGIIYVIGNHEFYGAEIFGIRRQIADRAAQARTQGVALWVLDDAAVDIDGTRFLGATLWTDYRLFGDGLEMSFAMREAKRGLNDHRVIRCAPDDGFSPAHALKLHQASATWLASELAKPFSGKTVVVTHHLPSARSVADRFKREPLSAAFASHLDSMVERADLWIHGHTHDSFDYYVGKCRVVCNPRGYVRGIALENSAFEPARMVEL